MAKKLKLNNSKKAYKLSKLSKQSKLNGKRRMSDDQEFQIMKLVLDKFLWLGFIVMGWGMYLAISQARVLPGLWYLIAGAVLLLLFLIIIVKEYEIVK